MPLSPWPMQHDRAPASPLLLHGHVAPSRGPTQSMAHLAILLSVAPSAVAFHGSRLRAPRVALWMGLLEDGVQSAVEGVQSTVEGVKAAYEDENFVPDGFARAHHILFLESDDAEMAADVVKQRVESGEFTFFEAATSFSACPTRDLEGNLGTFTSLSRLGDGTLRGGSLPYDGKNTAPFDELVFAPDTALNTIHKVRSQLGVHLVLILARGGQPDLIGQAAELVSRASRGTPSASEDPTERPGGPATRGFAAGGTKKKPKKRKKR